MRGKAHIPDHTTGHPAFGLLGRILVVADYTDPVRPVPGMEPVRRLSFRHLDLAYLAVLEAKMEEVRGKGRPICRLTIESRKAIISQIERSKS